MAELNFGLLTPPGSQSIGNAFAQGMDQAAVARAQENQNALAQYTLGKAKREDELTNKMLAGMQSATTLEQQAAVLRSVGKFREANDLLTSDLTQRELRGKLELQPTALASAQVKLVDDKLKQSRSMLEGVTTPEQYIAWHEANHNDPILGKVLAGRGVTMEQSRARINAALQQPGGLAQLINESRLGVEKFAELNRPQNVQRNLGGTVETLAIPGLGGPATVVPGSVGTVTPGPGTLPGIALADIARARAIDEGTLVPGVAPAQGTPGAAPAPAGAPVTQAAFPRITPQVQEGRTQDATAIKRQELVREQTNLAAAQQKLASQAAATDPDIRKFYEDRVKLHTDNISSLNQELRVRTNNMPGAAATAAAPVVNNLPTAQPPAGAAPGAYSPKMLRDMALKGMQPDGKGGQTFIPGGEKDPVVEQRVATSRAVGAQTGKNNAVALEKLPNAIKLSNELVGKLDALIGDANVVNGQIMYNTAPAKGFNTAFGPTGIIARAYHSSEAADFQARVKEILGGAFLEAFETLRGGGAITETEGRKATEARTRMSFSQSQGEFITAAREYRKAVTDAIAASSTRLKSLQGSAAPTGAPSLTDIFNPQRPQ